LLLRPQTSDEFCGSPMYGDDPQTLSLTIRLSKSTIYMP